MAASSPIVDALAKQLHQAADGTVMLQAPAIAAMQAQGLALATGRELYDAVGAIMRFAAFLGEQKKSPKVGEAVIMALKPLVEKLEAFALQDGEKMKAGENKLLGEKKSLTKTAGAGAALGPQPRRGVRIRPKTRKITK